MNDLASLYIERNDCTSCYRCVRECKQKAINITSDGVRIDPVKCIGCSACISMCKPGVIKLRNDIYLARKIIKESDIKVASVSPQWVTEFEGISPEKFVEALKLLGFTHVSESALGAQETMRKEHEYLRENGGIGISARCPAVVDYILKHRPRLRNLVLPVASPMIAHARMIKNWWGSDANVIHISGCVAAKDEAGRNDDLVPVALTFRELRRWFSEEGINFDKLYGMGDYCFEPYVAKSGVRYQLCGAMEAGEGVVSIAESTMEGVQTILEVAPTVADTPVWLDLMACSQGCLGSNGATYEKISRVVQRIVFERSSFDRARITTNYTLPYIDLSRPEYEPQLVDTFVPEGETVAALDKLGIAAPADQTDCNACGFVKCRRFAKALSRGEVKKEMCWQYANKEITKKFTTLISKLPFGVALVGADMKIEESNRLLASMIGHDVELAYDANNGLRGAAINDILPFAQYVSTVLENGEDSMVRDVQIKERMVTVSIHTIHKYKSVLVICRNMMFSQVRNEVIVARTQKVIQENLETVQKIAYMLGENASRTEAILNSILNSEIGKDAE